MSNTLHVRMASAVCDGYSASRRKIPMWAELAAERQGRKIGEEMNAELGVPVAIVVRTHWHRDGSVCAHIADRCFRITRRSIRPRKAR